MVCAAVHSKREAKAGQGQAQLNSSEVRVVGGGAREQRSIARIVGNNAMAGGGCDQSINGMRCDAIVRWWYGRRANGLQSIDLPASTRQASARSHGRLEHLHRHPSHMRTAFDHRHPRLAVSILKPAIPEHSLQSLCISPAIAKTEKPPPNPILRQQIQVHLGTLAPRGTVGPDVL